MSWLPPGFAWEATDTHIVLVAVLCSVACALLGNFLVLRRMSLMGDAISHAVLPGLAVAFILAGSRDSVFMLLGAAAVGLVTALLTEWVRDVGKVDESASMGVVFTILFALGLVIMRRAVHHVDLDPDCVLHGAIETASADLVPLLGLHVPRAALSIGGVLLLNLAVIALLFKELRIAAFDPALATTLGISARLMHYVLMTLVAVTSVACFEAVGSVLVIAMLIVPAATARLLTDRLSLTVVLSAVLAALAAGAGHFGAIVAPHWLGYSDMSTSTAGMVAVASGGLFAAAFVLAPRYGLLSRFVRRAALSLRIAREDHLAALYRAEEAGERVAQSAETPSTGPLLTWLARRWLRLRGLVGRDAAGERLTEPGRSAAAELLRAHRLWETYFDRNVALPTDHAHAPAERLEHVTGAELRQRLARSLGEPSRDPQGKIIPPETQS